MSDTARRYRPSWDSLGVLEDLKQTAGELRVLADSVHMEAWSPRHSNPAARQHLVWAAEQVRSWADDAQLAADAGDALDRRTALDTAYTRRAITQTFLHGWRGPLGVSE